MGTWPVLEAKSTAPAAVNVAPTVHGATKKPNYPETVPAAGTKYMRNHQRLPIIFWMAYIC
jgi:hypothetical protein